MTGVTSHGIRYPDGASKAKNLGPELKQFAEDVDGLVTNLNGPLRPIIEAIAETAVDDVLEDTALVTITAKSDQAVQIKYGSSDVRMTANMPASMPLATVAPVYESVPILTGGKLDPAVLPIDDNGTELAALTTELATVGGRGRPTYAPKGGTFDATRSLFNYSPGQMTPWFVARETARRGRGNAVIVSNGTSIDQIVGDIRAGETFPADAWPGQMLTRLGLPIGGTGVRHVSLAVPVTSHVGGFAEPTITIANPQGALNEVETMALGFAQSSFVKITDNGAKTAYVEFNTSAGAYTELCLYGGEITGTSVVTIDGVDRTWAGSTAVTGADIPALPGYAAGQRISKITLPNTTHTVRVHGTAAGVPFGGFEGRLASGVVLHRGAIAGRSLTGLFVTSGPLDGLNWAVDPWRAHLLLDGHIVNDWQSHYDLTTFKAQKTALWSRARAAGGAVLAIITPDPDMTLYPVSGGNNPPLDAYKAAVYEAALASDVPVLDLSHRWRDYPASAAFYPSTSDHIHPNSLGLSDIATAVTGVLAS